MAKRSQFALLKPAEDPIPPQPTRKEELAYLNRLEDELRRQPIQNTPPDPARQTREEMRVITESITRGYKYRFILGAILSVPLSIWLTRAAPYRIDCGIPMRPSPNYHVFRFWSLVAVCDLALASLFTVYTGERERLKPYEFYLYDVRRRHL